MLHKSHGHLAIHISISDILSDVICDVISDVSNVGGKVQNQNLYILSMVHDKLFSQWSQNLILGMKKEKKYI